MSSRGGAIPEHARNGLQQRLERHARTAWAGRCEGVRVRFRGTYAYVDAFPSEDEARSAPIQLCRLGYLGSDERWAFAFFRYSDETYETSVGFSGSFWVSPEEAFDCSAFAHLAA